VFTSGSKLFIAFGGLAAVTALVFHLSTGDLNGTILWATFGAAAFFLAGVVLAMRDGDVLIPAELAAGSPATVPSAPPVSPSLWPLAGALSVAIALIGLVSDRMLFLLGGILALATLIEWVVQAWSDRASADPRFNAEIRDTTIQSIEFPVLGAAALAVVILGFSRVMLALTSEGSLVAFVAIAVLILAVASFLAVRPSFGKGVVSVLLLLGGVAIVAAGIAGAVEGQREFEAHQAAEAEADETVREVADKSSTLGTITVAGGEAEVSRRGGEPVQTLSIPQSLVVNVLVTNGEQEPIRLVVEGGDVPTGEEDDEGNPVTEPLEFETSFIRPGKTSFLTFSIPNPGEHAYLIENEEGEIIFEGELIVS